MTYYMSYSSYPPKLVVKYISFIYQYAFLSLQETVGVIIVNKDYANLPLTTHLPAHFPLSVTSALPSLFLVYFLGSVSLQRG